MPPRLGEILVARDACTQDAVLGALRNQVIFGGRLGTNLLEVKAVGEDALAQALGAQHRLPSMSGDVALDPNATGLLTPEIADRYEAVPYLVADRRLAILVVDPTDLAMLDEVAFATGKQVHPIVVPEARVWALLRRTYGIDRHLRGIEVEFDSMTRQPAAPRAERSSAVSGGAGGAGGDLMDEGAFEELYRGGGPPAPVAPAPPPPDDVVELTDLLENAPPPAPAAPQLAAQVLATLTAAPGHAPPARRAVPVVARREEPEPSPLSFQEAVRFLEGVAERDAIARTVLRYARSKFNRAVLLTVNRGAALGWAGLGEKLPREAVRGIRIPLGTPGIVDTVVRTQAHFLGPIPKTEANVRLLKLLGGGVPGNAFLVPILALGRVVNVFYADNGKGRVVDGADLGELLILATRIAKSYDALLERVR